MRKPRLIPSIWTACRVAFTTFRTCATCIIMSRVKKDREYTLRHCRNIWGPSIFSVAGSTLEVSGGENVDFSKPHIYVMNHESYMDIPAAFMAVPSNIGFVAKQELEKIPLFGRTMRESGMIFVDRSNPQKAIASLKAGGALIRSGVNIFAFPEGTRTKTGFIRTFKKGIFMLGLEAGVPIVPMSITGARNVLPYGSFDPDPGVIKVRIGDPISLDGYTKDNKDELIAKVHAAVVALNLELGGEGMGPQDAEVEPMGDITLNDPGAETTASL